MCDKTIQICIDDAGIVYRLTYNNGRFAAGAASGSAGLVLHGSLYDYLLLASRQQDADALFFHRRLRTEGDTELGLYVKNFLDSLDLDASRYYAAIANTLTHSLPVYRMLFGRHTAG